jgi:hypothetical protein
VTLKIEPLPRDETLSVMSDLHKDARGFRPRIDFTNWTDHAIDTFFCELVDELAANEKSEKAREKRAWSKWTTEVAEHAQDLNISESDIVRFDMEAHDVEGDVPFYCFHRGLGYFREDEIINMLDG